MSGNSAYHYIILEYMVVGIVRLSYCQTHATVVVLRFNKRQQLYDMSKTFSYQVQLERVTLHTIAVVEWHDIEEYLYIFFVIFEN